MSSILCLLATAAGCGNRPDESIRVPEGFEIAVAAAPPLVERPMIIDDDEQGRLYVAESSGSNDDVQQQLVDRPHSILRLEDIDGDGRYDTRTVFADRMMFPEGVLWHDGSVYVAAPPHIWKLTDTDDDGVADERAVWFDAKTLTNCANDLHGPYLGPDGWIYWTKGAHAEQTYERPGKEPFVTRAAHVFRRRVEGGPVEPVLTGGMDNPVEVAFTPEGERLLTSTFLTHPQLGRRDGLLHAVYGGVYGKTHSSTNSHPMTGGYMPVMTHMGGAAPVGLARYGSGIFGKDYRGRLFVTSFNLRKVTSHKLVPNGASFATEDENFLVAASRDFHPTDVMEDADGSLLVVDTGGWYKLCCPTAQLTKPDILGAIYRIRKRGSAAPADPRGLLLDWNGAESERLAAWLGDRRPAVRDRAISALAKREAVETLQDALRNDGSEETRRNAVWALTRIDSESARSAVRNALADPSESVRHAALHSIAVHRDSGALAGIRRQLHDSSAAIRRVAAEALGRVGAASAVGDLLALAGETEDMTLSHSLTYALIEIGEPDATRRGLEAESAKTRRAAMIALDQMQPAALDAAIAVRALASDDPLITGTAEWIASRHPEWGGHLVGYLQRRLGGSSPPGAPPLDDQLRLFSAHPDVQALLARTASGSGPAGVRVSALEAMIATTAKAAPAGWAAAIATSLKRPETVGPAVQAARALPRPEGGIAELDRALLALARDADAAVLTRLQALEAAHESLDGLDAELFALATEQVLPAADVAARGSAARVLANVPLSREQLGRLAGLLPAVGPMELPELVQAFGSAGDAEIGAMLVTGLSDAKGLANLRADVLNAVSESYPAEIRAQLDGLLEGEVAELAEQGAALDALLAELGSGDIRRGQSVFNSSEGACMSCHVIGYQGGTIGPDLTRIGEIRSRRDLLEAIVYPNASFVRSYEPVSAVTVDGVVNGVPVEDSETHLVLAVNADEQVRIPRGEIEEIRPGTASVMPSGLDEQLSAQELADLLAFLEATEWGPGRSAR